MNPLRIAVQQPGMYRLVVRSRALTYWSERFLRILTRGRIGVLDLVGLPSIQLTVAGRRTGIPHTTSLQFVPDGDDMLVVGSNWGSDDHPAWSANLMAAKQVTVRRGSEQFTSSVRRLTGAERARAWGVILDAWPNYRIAQEAAGGREFRLFALRRIR